MSAGRMHVKLTVHGGPGALLEVMEGLVESNAEAIRKGRVPRISGLKESQLRYVAQPNWCDAEVALKDGMGSAGTLAAWRAGEMRADYDDPTVRIGLRGGVPVVISGLPGKATFRADPSFDFGRPEGYVQPITGSLEDPDRVSEYLIVQVDDKASVVRHVGDSMAKHNARQILARGLPPLYQSGAVYRVEGSPELWYDAAEIVRLGYDDCEGLAAYRAGELIAQGHEAGVWTRAIDRPAEGMGGRPGGRLFHALTRVNTPEGPKYDDPSVRLGMPVPEWYRKQLQQQRKTGQVP